MNVSRIVLLLILGTAALRLLLASVGGLGFDEAYMVGNARSFALSYLDHPPMHIWIVGGWARLLGSEDALLLRLPFIALFAGSTWLMYRLTAQLFNARAGLWAALFINLAPVLSLAHSTWVLPDGPLIFFMLATANIVARILFGERPPARPVLWWIAAGVCGGLACLSKFHGAFLFLAIFVFMLTVPAQRRWLVTPGPWLGVLAAIIVFSPVIIWNLQHGYDGVVFQADRLSPGSGMTWRYLPTLIGGQVLYLAPWLFVPLLYCLAGALWRGPAAPKGWLLGLLAIGPIVAPMVAALFGLALPHWTVPGWLFVFPMMGKAWVSLEQRRPKFVRHGTILAAVIPALLVAALVVQIANGGLGRAIPGLFVKHDPTLDLLNWQDLGTALAARKLIDEETPAVSAANWTEAAKVNYAIGRAIPVLCMCAGRNRLAFSHQPKDFVGKNLILVGTTGEFFSGHISDLMPRFERIEPLAPVLLRRGGQPALQLQLFRGIGFKG